LKSKEQHNCLALIKPEFLSLFIAMSTGKADRPGKSQRFLSVSRLRDVSQAKMFLKLSKHKSQTKRIILVWSSHAWAASMPGMQTNCSS
jgi:hypothetical protein